MKDTGLEKEGGGVGWLIPEVCLVSCPHLSIQWITRDDSPSNSVSFGF